MEIIRAAIIKKYQTEIITALALILLGSGAYNVSDNGQEIVIDMHYNVYGNQVKEVSTMMQEVIENPTKANLVNAQQDLYYEYYPWAKRQTTGEQRDNFIDYLEACNQVVIQLSHGYQPDTSKMDELKDKLN